MQYKRFIIRNYRAITGPLEINVATNPLIPIIGINECGKTTILNAIFAFDKYADALNDGRQLEDTHNLYGTAPTTPIVSAEISLQTKDFVRALDNVANENVGIAAEVEKYRRKRNQFPHTLQIDRNLTTKRYGLPIKGFRDPELNHLLATQLIQQLPYILYFDDFRDSIEETIDIVGDEDSAEGWLSILQQLFKKTDPHFSVFDLAGLEERRRKSVLAQVRRELNRTLTKEWQNFRLDDSDALEIAIEFKEEGQTTGSQGGLKLEIIETNTRGEERYFFIRDRSKGFFWFFNFVMKLEFNPKIIDDKSATIYLLDEPGSYLHASAQSRLCRKLRQLSKDNRVIYCTHSHYLLDPEVIPISTIRVAEKSGTGAIQLIPIQDYQETTTERRLAFQPVFDALRVKPIMLDWNAQCTIITEGIYDYYAMQLFRQNRKINIVPSVGADSIRFYISLCIAAHVPYRAIWDNDETGRRELKRASELFGDGEAKGRFFLLPSESGNNRILQNLFDGEDLRMIREALQIPDASFEKTIATLHFATEKADLMARLSAKTRDNFAELYETLRVGVAGS